MRKSKESSRLRSSGVNFYLYDRGFSTQLKAQKAAFPLKRSGYRVRAIYLPDGWAIYRRRAAK